MENGIRPIASLLEIERVPTSKITMAKFIGCDLIPAIFSWTQTSIVNWGMARNFYPRPSWPTFSYRAILRRDNCLYNRWSWDDIIYSSLIRRKPKHITLSAEQFPPESLCVFCYDPLRYSVSLRSQVYSIDPVEGCIVAQCRGRVYRRRVWIFPWLLQLLRGNVDFHMDCGIYKLCFVLSATVDRFARLKYRFQRTLRETYETHLHTM